MNRLWVVGFCTETWNYVFTSEERAWEFYRSRDEPENWVIGVVNLTNGVGAIENADPIEGEFC